MRFLMWAYVAVAIFNCAARPSASSLDCEALYVARQWDACAVQCLVELMVKPDPAIWRRAAWAHHYLGKYRESAGLALPLLEGPLAADAELLIGTNALALGALPAADRHLARAMAMYGAAGNFGAQASAAHQLAGVWFQQGEYQRAFEALAAARAAATRAEDHRMQVLLDVAMADLYRAAGDLPRARELIERAIAAAREPSDKAAALFQLAAVQLDDPRTAGFAVATFERFLESERREPTQRPEFRSAALVNLALSDRRPGGLARALERLAEAERIGLEPMTLHMSRGRIFLELDRLDEAIAELAAAEAANPAAQWGWTLPYYAAIAHARKGDLERAITEDRRAIAKVTELAAQSGAQGPQMIASLRQPHLHLIGLHAQRRQWREVLEVVATLDVHALIDSQEDPLQLGPSSPELVTLRAAPRRTLGAASAVSQAWRGRALVVVVPGGERAWRIALRDGALEGSDLGAAAPLEQLARQLEVEPAEPGTAQAGRTLGEALLGGVPADRPIDLLVVGPLARAPLAALRLGERLAIETHRIARVPGVLPLPRPKATARPAAGGAIVLGDPGGDLPRSAEAAGRIAARLGVAPQLGAAATRAALARAEAAPLLHVSVHTHHDLNGAALVLADGRVPADELARRPVPARVVLASCGSAAGRDESGAGSLASAFLDAGAEHVVATRWTVEDAGAAALIEAFYEERGDRDPVRGLAAAQRRLAGRIPGQTWAAFEVFAGRPIGP